ncbi:UNKNOWN [Stylonychia lemnae]|uniref:Uncharacterized protein n=1 Tax=Stylonychia lemnae TaxID=5949 RepID=A0A078AQW3_STYLE|nr:UNKNOWN [Stylonychia lemnae]|eukprot:CDW84331.1 UNKNOWN [Stylonychia lemnae]
MAVYIFRKITSCQFNTRIQLQRIWKILSKTEFKHKVRYYRAINLKIILQGKQRQSQLQSIISGQAFTKIRKVKKNNGLIVPDKNKSLDRIMSAADYLSGSQFRSSNEFSVDQVEIKTDHSNFQLLNSRLPFEQIRNDNTKSANANNILLEQDTVNSNQLQLNNVESGRTMEGDFIIDRNRLNHPSESLNQQKQQVSKISSSINSRRQSIKKNIEKKLKVLSSRNSSPQGLKKLFDNYFAIQQSKIKQERKADSILTKHNNNNGDQSTKNKQGQFKNIFIAGGADEIRNNYLLKVLDKINKLHQKKEKKRKKLLKQAKKEQKESDAQKLLLRELNRVELEIQMKIQKNMKKIKDHVQSKRTLTEFDSLKQDEINKEINDEIIPINKKETSTTDDSSKQGANDLSTKAQNFQRNRYIKPNRRLSTGIKQSQPFRMQPQAIDSDDNNVETLRQISNKLKLRDKYLKHPQQYFQTINNIQTLNKDSRTLSRLKQSFSQTNQESQAEHQRRDYNSHYYSKQDRQDLRQRHNFNRIQAVQISNASQILPKSKEEFFNNLNPPSQNNEILQTKESTPQSHLNLNFHHAVINQSGKGLPNLRINQSSIISENQPYYMVPSEKIKNSAKKNQKRFEELMKYNWEEKISSLKDQVNQIKSKPRFHQIDNASNKGLETKRDTSRQKKVVQFTLPEI